MLIAEFHSVWRAPLGNLIDLTPPRAGSSVLFIEDSRPKITASNGIYWIPTDLTDHPAFPRVFLGSPTDDTHWPLDPSIPAINNYTEGLGFDIAEIVS